MGEHIQISKYVNADMKQVISELKNNEWYFSNGFVPLTKLHMHATQHNCTNKQNK